MGRLAIRRVEYFGDTWTFTSPELPDGLVIVEGSNGSGKTTFAELIRFGLGGAVKQFGKRGSSQHTEIRDDTNNSVRLTIDIDGELYFVSRRFEAPEDVLVASPKTTQVEVLPVVRKDGRRIFSDWILEAIGIQVMTLYSGAYAGKLNFRDIMRLMYHDQDPDPSRVFKKPDQDSFVSDSREFRRAIFEILIGKASEEYYSAIAELKSAQALLAECKGSVGAYSAIVTRASKRMGTEADANAVFLTKEIEERENQLRRLQQARQELRDSSPNAPAGQSMLVQLRHQLTRAELLIANAEQRGAAVQSEKARLMALEKQLVDEGVRVQKIMHAHETLALFSPDTCPCCLRNVQRAPNYCICGQMVEESNYQRFFYSLSEYQRILKAKQKNVETVRSAIQACEKELNQLAESIEQRKRSAYAVRGQMEGWAGVNGNYGTELEQVDDAIVNVRVLLDQLRTQLDLELERDKLVMEENKARGVVERLQQRTKALELDAQESRSAKITQFEERYTALMRETLKRVRFARLDSNYEPILNDAEYREASSAVIRRLMYFVTLLQMSLEDPELPFPRFLLIDTPDTAGIDPANMSPAIAKLADVLDAAPTQGQVILTIGDGRYPEALKRLRRITLDEHNRLLRPQPSGPENDGSAGG